MNAVHPTVTQIAQINWDYFGTLTFKKVIPERFMITMYFSFIRRVSASFHQYFPRLVWVLRYEEGEITGRPHYHYLIANLSDSPATQSGCMAQAALWERVGGGHSVVRVYDRSLAGVEYISKILCTSAAQAYELNKFGEAKGLRLSHGAMAILRSRAHVRQLAIQQGHRTVKSHFTKGNTSGVI